LYEKAPDCKKKITCPTHEWQTPPLELLKELLEEEELKDRLDEELLELVENELTEDRLEELTEETESIERLLPEDEL